MRLRRLYLTRYGKFTDHSIDFGEQVKGRPDLHIVYGPNESGKSTALAAFLDLLFGIEVRSRFNFLHPYSAMRIGASLEFTDGVLEVARIKRAQNSLLDGNNRPIGEGILAGQLGGIDRDSYRAMFSLDDDTLEAGGESILASQGDLGQLLFSASAGLAELSQTLISLRSEADGFYRYHAHGGELSNLKARLTSLREERERIDTAASRYAQLVEARDHSRAQYNGAIATRTAILSRMDEIQRRVSALPRLAALREARERLEPFSGLPVVPVGWLELLPKLQEEDITLSVRSESIDREISRRSAELEALIVDETAVRLADRVDRLADLNARYVTADKDIPERRLQVHEEEIFAIAGILGRIGRAAEPDPHRLILDASTHSILQDLVATRSGIEASTEAASNALSEAGNHLDEARAKLQDADVGVRGAQQDEAQLSALAAVVATLRADDHAARRRVAERSRAQRLDELEDRLRALRPWLGDVEQLAALVVPDRSTIQRWKTALAAAQSQSDRREQELERLKGERLRLEAERNAIASIEGVVSDQDAGSIRAAREAAWANHRRTLDPISADVFEAALRHDDIVMNTRLRHEGDVARLHQTGLSLAIVEVDAGRAQETFDTAAVKLQTVHNEIAAAVSLFLPSSTTVDELEAWLEKRGRAFDTRMTLGQIERDLREAETDATDARTKLVSAMNAAGVKPDLEANVEELRAVAQSTLDHEAEFKLLRAGAEDRLREVRACERTLATARERDQTWHTAWAEACQNCWLGEAGGTPSLATVREILRAVTDLGPALDRRTSLIDRIEKMQNGQRKFVDEIVSIARALGFATVNDAPLELATRINNCVEDARTTLKMRTTKTQESNEAHTRQSKLAEQRAIHDKRKAEMTAFFEVGSLAEVASKLAAIGQKVVLEAQAADATRDILDALRLRSIEDAETALDDADRAGLDAELVELKGRFEDQDQRTRDLFLAHSKVVDQVEAVGGDAAVALIEEQRRTTLLEIEEGAVQYLKLRVGIVAADYALRSYRQQHRSSMMAHASEAFQIMSRGTYVSLASQPNRDSEILIARGADGTSKIASELSKGARFQLYLALRVAGYHEFARLRAPVPFVADDIMETFDDFRTEEALRLFAEMGEVGQVIYMTHHQHVCGYPLSESAQALECMTCHLSQHRCERPRGSDVVLFTVGAVGCVDMSRAGFAFDPTDR